jgi:hypothetical protein
MPALILPLGFPVTQAGGTEGLGKDVRTDLHTTVSPNGQSLTPAALQSEITTVLNQGGANVFALWKPSLNASPQV